MHRNFFIYSFLAPFLFTLTLFSELRADDFPVFDAPTFEHDFGSVDQGKTLSHDFLVKNSGKGDLVIREIKPSCGCTAAVLEDPIVKPGSHTYIRVSFNTSGFKGEKSKTIRVYSNDSKNASVVFVIKANIVPEIFIEPAKVEIFNLKRGEEVSQEIFLKTNSGEPVPFKDVISKSEYIIVSSQDIENGEVKIKISISSSIPSGILRSRVVVRTNNPRVPVVNIPVYVDVVRDFLIEERSVKFGYINEKLSKDLLKEIFVGKQKWAPDNLKVTQVSVSGSNFVNARVIDIDEKNQKIIIELSKNAKGVVRANIVIQTNHSDSSEQVIEIPLYAVIDND